MAANAHDLSAIKRYTRFFYSSLDWDALTAQYDPFPDVGDADDAQKFLNRLAANSEAKAMVDVVADMEANPDEAPEAKQLLKWSTAMT